ncbi:MAG: hypothetical protein KBS64_07635 [Treponema sp.]|nr:hypothetical protein [Candidatus Treponema equi]
MTIRIRNRLFLILFVVGLAFFAITLTLFAYGAFNGLLKIPGDPYRAGNFLPFSFEAALSSILYLGFAGPALAFFIYRSFEKTSSLEILFFSGVIISCIAEQSRILIAVLDLWHSSSKLLVTLGRISVTGKILAPLSLLFGSLFSSSEQLENAERNLFFLFATSCAFGFFYPINSCEIGSNCSVLYGMKSLFAVIRILILMTAIITTFINSYTPGARFRDNRHVYGKCLGIVIFSGGLLVLFMCDSIVALAVGISLFTTGIVMYLKTMHYMANNWS